MSATLHMVRDNEPAGQFQVGKDLCHIGSKPGCDLQIEGIAPHAVTLQFRDQQCIVFNRTERELRLDIAAIPPGESLAWRNGQTLHLSARWTLRLQWERAGVTSSGSPDRTAWRGETHATAASVAPVRPLARRSRWTLLAAAVTALAILILSSAPSQPATDAPLSSLVDRLYRVAAKDVKLAAVYQLLQEARSLEMRKDWDRALDHYGHARDLMLRRRDPRDPLNASPEVKRFEEQTIRFIRDRLSGLR